MLNYMSIIQEKTRLLLKSTKYIIRKYKQIYFILFRIYNNLRGKIILYFLNKFSNNILYVIL